MGKLQNKPPWRAGFKDGSGTDHITTVKDEHSVAKVRWGCGCCEDREPLSPEERATRNFIIRAANNHARLLRALKKVRERFINGDPIHGAIGRAIRAAEKEN